MTAKSTVALPDTHIPLFAGKGFEEQASAVAAAFGFLFEGEAAEPQHLDYPFVLWLDDTGLSVRQTGRRPMGPIRCDFVAGSARHRRLYGGGKSQAVAKAVGVRERVRPCIADLTGGLGADAFVLASLGCRVTVVERHPVIAALLADGLARAVEAARRDPALADITGRISYFIADGHEWLASLTDAERPDVIYLDPMFPERRKSAQVNKTMQVFQHLVGADADADELLPKSLAVARYRVAVKRPAGAPWLGNEKPGLVMEGKSVRYDVYPLQKIPDDLC